MNTLRGLPFPRLATKRAQDFVCHSDDALFEACGVRIAFSERHGGVSVFPYESLNLSGYVGDTPEAVEANRRILSQALCGRVVETIVPRQVHEDRVLELNSTSLDALESLRHEARVGADGVLIEAYDVAALLCFADCVPVIMVAPSGAFAVIHAGWRGVRARIAPKALGLLGKANDVAQCNIYLGPYIHRECFATSAEVHDDFVAAFGESCSFDSHHIDLGVALTQSLIEAGADARRICDLDACTCCDTVHWYSYRAEDGHCGRHGAFAVRLSEGARC